MIKKIMSAINGYKTYIILVLLALVSFYNGTAGTLDISLLLSDSDLLKQELFLALAAAGRSALDKIGVS
jgi:hypothetical protein|tara:strand:+ start:1308 stop:1514 length:207 start_codon:yes stop_codon:yes gene_type:complete